MIFNNHSNLEGQHAFLGASKYHWINYDETKVADAPTTKSTSCSEMELGVLG